MKYALILLLALGIVWWWRQERKADAAPNARPSTPPKPPVEMVACAECGLNLPRQEALADGPGGSAPYFCGQEHRARHRG